MEVLTYTIILFAMKVCDGSTDMVGMKDISKGNCVATPSQEYDTEFVRSLRGKPVEIKKPKYCTIKVICQSVRK